jgi:MFS family permease
VLFFLTFGATSGMMSPVVGALWAEMYGTVHIGKIRALVGAAFVSASAVGPGLSGVLIDANVDLNQQSFFYAAYCFIAAGGSFLLTPLLSARVTALAEERAAVS